MGANQFNKKYGLARSVLLMILFAGSFYSVQSQNYALTFDGSGDFVNFGNPAGLQITGSQTIEMWIHPYSMNARRNPIAKAYAGEGTMTLETDGTISYFYGTGGGNNSPYQGFSSPPIPVNDWTHIALVRDLSAMKLYWYFNGVQVAVADAQYPNAQSGTLPFYIGRGYVSDFHGMLDEVRIWNIARSASDIAAYKNAGLTGAETGLAGYWPFDEGSGATIVDNSPNVHNGTVNGNTAFIVSSAPVFPYTPGGEPFEPVPPTGLPYNIVLAELKINGENIPVGAQIGVFDGELCVGTAFYDGSPSQNLVAWQADPGQNLAGFTPGNPMSFKYHMPWHSEIRNFDATKTMVRGDGNFGFVPFSAVNLSVTTNLVPEITISAEIINFNTVVVNQSLSLPLAFENNGTAILSITSIQNSKQQFTRSTNALLIAPGEKDTLWITFTPTAVTSYSDLLTFNTDVPDMPSVSIPLYGTGLPQPTPQIVVTPSSLNFGGIAMNTTKTMIFNILNPGNGNLSITGIVSSNAVFTILGSTSFTLGQGENTNVTVLFSPTQPGGYYGQLTIQNNVQNYVIPVYGVASQGHFTSVAPTGKPYMILAQEIDIDGFSPIVGDEIAVFDDELCVGLGIAGGGGNSLQLNGSNGYVINDNSSAFDLQQMTISAWVFSSNFNQNGFIFEKGPVNSQYSLFFEGGNINFRTYPTSGGYDDFYVNWSSIGIQNNKWNHITVTYNGVQKAIYVNGLLKASKAFSQPLRTGQVGQIIGAYGGSGGHSYFFNGNIDEVRVWSKARSVFEIQSDMNRQLNGNEPNLVGYWNFNDGNFNNLVAGSTLSYLVGSASLLGPQNGEIFNNMLITAWEKDDALGLPGFTAGNPMSFKVWTEIYDNWVEVEAVPEYLIGNGTFGFGQMSVVNLEGTSGLEPDIVVPIENLYVGQVTVGSSVVNSVEISNQGNAPLHFTLSDNSAAFSTNISGGTIAPAESAEFQVTFTPATAGGYSAVLLIQSNDPDETEIPISLEGFALPAGASNIATSVSQMNFGGVEIGSPETHSIIVINTGTSALTVSNITFNNAAFTAIPTSFSLQNTNDQMEVLVTFLPVSKGLFDAMMTINSNAPQKQVSLIGIGIEDHFNTVDPTGLPYTIIVQSTNLAPGAIKPGDELVVMDNGQSVGSNAFSSAEKVLGLDGNGDFVEIPDHSSLDLPGNQLTIEAWVKTNSYAGDYRCIIGKIGWTNISDWSYNFHIADNGTLHFNFVNTSGTSFPVNSPTSILNNVWHHVAATYDGSLIRLYINGDEVINLPASGNLRQNNQPVKIGSWHSADANYFNGNLDEIRLWNYARTEEEIQTGMYSSLSGSEPGLAGYWNFNSNTANDISINGNHGTLTGNASIVPDWRVTDEHTIIAWQQDLPNGLPGFTPGNPMSFKLWTEINGFPTELSATPTYVVGNGNFGYGQFTVVNLEFGLPEISVDPMEIFVAVEEPESTDVTLTISNNGVEALQYNIPDTYSNGMFTASYYYSPGTGASPPIGPFIFETEDEFIDSNWGSGGPGNGVGSDDFQVIWTGLILAETAGTYQFRSVTDDGKRLYIDGQLIIDQWYDMGGVSHSGSIVLTPGLHELEFQFYENGGGAQAYLYWTPPGQPEALVPAADIQWIALSPSSGTIAPGEFAEITVTFNSEGLNDGLYGFDLLINNNTPGNSPVTVPVSMNVTGNPQISSSVPVVEFGQVVVNETGEQTFNLKNIGTKDLIITDISVAGGIANGFSYALGSKSLPITLPPGQSVPVVVEFTPLLPGQANDTLLVESNAGNAASFEVPLSGLGITPPDIFLAETSFSFTHPCNDELNSSFTIENQGEDILSVSITSDNTWLVANPLQATVPGGESTTINVNISTFDLFAGVHEAMLSIQSNDPDEPMVQVIYTLTITGEPVIVCNDFLNLGTVNVGETYVGQLTVANGGCDDLEVYSVNLQSQFAVFSVDNSGFIVPPGDAALLNISFTPLASQQYSGILTINSNDAGNPALPIVVAGTGVEPPKMSVFPLAVSSTLQSGDSGQESVAVQNTGGLVLEFDTEVNPVNPYMLHLDGSGDYINVNHSELLNPSDALTLEAWVYLYDNTNEFIIGKENSTEGKYRFYVNSGSRFEFKLNNQFVVTSNLVAAKNQWYHVAATFDGSTMRIFVNGNPEAEQTFAPFTILTNTDNLRVGRSYQFSYFNGLVDEIRVWNIARNQSEIQSAMSQSLLGTEPELLLYFPFISPTGNIVTDASSNNHNGIMFGDPVRLNSTVPFDDYLSVINGSGNLTAGQQQDVTLELNSAGFFAGNYQREITVNSNAIDNPVQTVSLDLAIEGEGNVETNPTQIQFENTFIGLKDTFELVIANSGATASLISGISFSAPVFYSLNTVNKVFPFSQKSLLVVFEPDMVQLFEGMLTITVEGGKSINIQVPLSGLGVTPPIPVLNPLLAEFGSVVVNHSESISFSLGNNGTSALEVYGFSLTNAALFSSTLQPPQTIAFGQQAQFDVTFTPVNYDPVTAQMILSTNIGQIIIPLSGVGMPPEHDLAITALLSPQNGCGLSEEEVLSVTVHNFGTLPQSDFNVGFTVNGGAQIVEMVSGTLASGQSLNYTFNQTLNFFAIGNYTLEVSTLLGNDQNTGNDTLNQVITNFPSVGVVTGLLPADGASGVTEPVTFSWAATANATAYDLYIWRTSQQKPATPTVAGITGTSHTYTEYLNKNYLYNWQITARNQCSQSESAVHVFSFNVFSDLTVNSVVAPETANSGEYIDIIFTVANTGTGGTGIIPWKDDIYLSLTSTFDPVTAVKVASVNNKNALNQGQSYINTVNIKLADYLEGSFYVFVVTDANNIIQETDENNNLLGTASPLVVSLPPYPDLTVSNIQSLSGNIIPGQPVTIGWNVLNIGDAPGVGGWSQRVALISGSQTQVLGFIQNTEVIDPAGVIGMSTNFNVSTQLNMEGDIFIQIRLTPNPALVEKPNGAANNTVLSDETVILEKRLTISIPQPTLNENSTFPLNCMVYRSGDMSQSLTLNMSVSEENRVTIPSTLIIPVGQAGAPFSITAINNAVIEGNIALQIFADAPGYPTGAANLTIVDDETPSLAISLSMTEANEGDIFQLTVTRDLVTANPLTVTLFTTRPNQITLPANIVIPADVASATIDIPVVQNATPELTEDVVINATVAGYLPSSATVTILDDDLPQITLTLNPETVSEGGGPYASWGTVSLDQPANGNIVVLISSDPSGQLFFPSQVTIPNGQYQQQFNVGAVDNGILDGDRTVEISAAVYIASCGCGAPAGTGGADTKTLTILDNDGPSLSVSANPFVVPENLVNAGLLTITRNTLGGEAITVNLQHNSPDEIDIQETAVIPEGATSVNVPFNTIDDGIEDGDQIVTITVTSQEYSSGSCWIIVSDRNLPDYVVGNMTLSQNEILINDPVQMSFTISNEGFALAGDGAEVKFYRSDNNSLSGDDLLISTQYTGSVLNIGESLQMNFTYTPDDKVGDFFIIANVNANGAKAELVAINNTTQAVPLSIVPDYTATVTVDGDVFNGTTPITINGVVETVAKSPAPDKAVDVYVVVNG
ncbi:MAG: choice-of-anchor D domain-containing protein, partial [Bacteroidales bacterium]|nr:choice-of-anchor D domain-containing protein [Bacteroidales bacterium]